jgi:hypothetical protein
MATIRVGDSIKGGTRTFSSKIRKESIVSLPPFSFSGEPGDGDQTGRWFPRVAVQLTGLVVTARTVGTTTGLYTFKRKGINDANPLVLAEDREWGFDRVELAAGALYTSRIDSPEEPFQWSFDASDWLSVECTAGGGHEDVVFQFTGRATGVGYISRAS